MSSKSDIARMASFGCNDVEVLEQEEVYAGFHRIVRMRLRHRLYKGGWSNTIEREVSARGEAASVVVYDPKLDAVCLVEQFRAATISKPSQASDSLSNVRTCSPWSLEIVAGMLDKDCLLYTSPSPRDRTRSRMPSSA